MKGRIPFQFLFHGFFDATSPESAIDVNDVDNLFTKNVSRLSRESDIINRVTVQPMSVPYPRIVTPYKTEYTYFENNDIKQLGDIPKEANWLYVSTVKVLRTDSEAAPIGSGDSPNASPLKVTWKDRITTHSDNSGFASGLYSYEDPWTGRLISPANSTTSSVVKGDDFTQRPMINGRRYPIGSPESSLDKEGLIVPAQYGKDKSKDNKSDFNTHFPGQMFAGEAINSLMREDISKKGVLTGFQPNLLLNDPGGGIRDQGRYNAYDTENEFNMFRTSLVPGTIPGNNISIGVTGEGNFDKHNYSWMNVWDEDENIISIVDIKDTGLMRYYYELPYIGFTAPGRESDEHSLRRGYVTKSAYEMELIEFVVLTVKDLFTVITEFVNLPHAFFTVNLTVDGFLGFANRTSDFALDMLWKEAMKQDRDRVTSNETLDTHYNSANSLIKTSDTYITNTLVYPQPQLVGGEDNLMYNYETQSEVIIPINKLFKSLDDFSSYLKKNNLQDVSHVNYIPYMKGYNYKWELLKKFGFRRTDQQPPSKGSERTDNLKRVGDQLPSRQPIF